MVEKHKIEFRNVTTLEPRLPSNEEKDSFIVEGYASTFDKYPLMKKDGLQYYEQIDRNAFTGVSFGNVIMQYDHEGRVLARVSNGTLRLEVNDKGLYVIANLGSSNAGRELYDDIKKGLVNSMSFSFIVGERALERKTRTIYITKISNVLEVGAVSIPANEYTTIAARSVLDKIIRQRQRKRIQLKTVLLEEGF